jgi:hypothetical protein
VTRVRLAEALGVSRQTLQSCEVGRRRIPVSALQVAARTLACSPIQVGSHTNRLGSSRVSPDRIGYTLFRG